MKRTRLYDILADRQAQKQDQETIQALAERLDEREMTADQSKVSPRAQVFLQWWHFYDAVGDLNASTVAAQHAIALAQAYGDKESDAQGNLFLGATSWRQTNYPAAQEHINKALALARVIRSRTLEGDCLRKLGITLQFQGNYLEARAHHEEAMHIYQEIGDERGEAPHRRS